MVKRLWVWLGLAAASCGTPRSDDRAVQPAEHFVVLEAPGFG